MTDKPSEWAQNLEIQLMNLQISGARLYDAIADEGARRAWERHYPGGDPEKDANLTQGLSDVEELRNQCDELTEERDLLKSQLARCAC